MTTSPFRWGRLLPALTIVASVLPLLLAPVRARELSPDGRGEFAFFQSSFTIISTFGALGARHAYYSLRAAGLPDGQLLGPQAALSAWGASAFLGLPLFFISLTQHSGATTALIAVAILLGPMHLYVQLQLARAQYDGRAHRIAITTATPAVWEFLSNLVLAVANWMMVLSVSLATMAAELLRAVVSRGSRPVRSSAEDRKRYTQLLWRYAIVGAMPMLVANVDVIVYGALIPQAELGYYVVARLAVTLLVFGTMVLEGRFVARDGQFARTATIMLSVLAVAALVGGTAGTYLIVPIFGRDYAPAASIFGVMAAVGFAAGAHLLFSAHAAGRQRNATALTSSVAVFVVTASLAVVVALHSATLAWLALPVGGGYAVGLVILVVGLRLPPSAAPERTAL